MDQSQVDEMVALGVQDGINSVNGGQQDTENTTHFFALKNTHDERVKGKSFDEFMTLKTNGTFGDDYKILNDTKFQSLFLQ